MNYGTLQELKSANKVRLTGSICTYDEIERSELYELSWRAEAFESFD